MEQDDICLEEGELSHDSGDEYTPLERPPNYSKTQPIPRLPAQTLSESEEEEYQSNDSDSDSDPNVKKVKKPKIRLKPQPQLRTQKNKKYDIWSSRLQEDSLAATLNQCDVEKKDRSRDVESYDFSVARRYYDNLDVNMFSKVDRPNNKRTRSNRNNVHFRQRQRSHSDDREVKAMPKIIPDLTVNINNTAEDIAKDIADRLSEEKEDLILKVINILGKQKAIEIFEETKKVEADGGILIMNKTRRRTSGGLYLYLVRQDYYITPEQRNEIFGDERRTNKECLKKKQKERISKERKKIAKSREKILPDLLTRAELLASQNPSRKIKEAGDQDQDFVNPPPTPETDCYENSRDGMEGSTSPAIETNLTPPEDPRGKLNTYDDDFLDLGCGDDMDLF